DRRDHVRTRRVAHRGGGCRAGGRDGCQLMDLTTALIILGIVVLAAVFAVSLYRDRLLELVRSSRPKMGSLGGSLVRSRDFFLGRTAERSGEEPRLGRITDAEQLDIHFEPTFDASDEV